MQILQSPDQRCLLVDHRFGILMRLWFLNSDTTILGGTLFARSNRSITIMQDLNSTGSHVTFDCKPRLLKRGVLNNVGIIENIDMQQCSLNWRGCVFEWSNQCWKRSAHVHGAMFHNSQHWRRQRLRFRQNED
eukprot:UN03325